MTLAVPLFEVPGCEIGSTEQRDEELLIMAHTNNPESICPSCGRSSSQVHSYYTRKPHDLPISEWRVRLCLRVRRFRCSYGDCPQQTFAERIPDLLAVHAQRTTRLTATLHRVALALGGEAGARLTKPLHMPTSAATLLRIIRQVGLSPVNSPCVLGVDDFALRKGCVYGTILVDLEQHRPIDLLSDRKAPVLSEWLILHPGVEVIVRDRSTEYARGATDGAPHAQQVADRWHLLQNVRQMLERMFTRIHAELSVLPILLDAPQPEAMSTVVRTERFLRAHPDEETSQASREKRLKLYKDVQRLRSQGHNILQIAHMLGIARGTARKNFYAEAFPERAQRKLKPSLLDPYLSFLVERHQAGCENAQQLWREIREQGYPGTARQVSRWMHPRRKKAAPTTPTNYLTQLRCQQAQTEPVQMTNSATELPSAKELAWLFIRDPRELTVEHMTNLARISQHEQVWTIYPLIQQFVSMVCRRPSTDLDSWLQACADSTVACLQTFAKGIQQDYAAVRAAIQMPWSNGQTEGQVNRLKLIKRQMYGRANFDLLRLRVLAA
jgi:transposase